MPGSAAGVELRYCQLYVALQTLHGRTNHARRPRSKSECETARSLQAMQRLFGVLLISSVLWLGQLDTAIASSSWITVNGALPSLLCPCGSSPFDLSITPCPFLVHV